MTLENLDREHFARNPLLSTIAFELGKTEHSGSGISRIKQEMAALGSPPPIFQADDLSFQVTLPARHPDVLRDAARVRYTV